MPTKTKKPSARTVALAQKALDGMEFIVRRERVVRGTYITDEQDGDSDAICTGRRACLLGSLWLGAGVKPDVTLYDEGDPVNGIGPTYDVELPGVGLCERQPFLARRPGLKLAYDAINEAATRRVKRLNEDERELVEQWGAGRDHPDFSIAEALFEAGPLATGKYDETKIDRGSMLRLIGSARKIVEARAAA